MMNTMNKQKGVSLIELIIFIVVLGILGAGILMAFVVSLEKIPNIHRVSRATELAQKRMELLWGQKNLDFDSLADPCQGGSPPAICTLPSWVTDYQIDPTDTIHNNYDGKSYLKEIRVIVERSDDSSQLASLQAVLTHYHL